MCEIAAEGADLTSANPTPNDNAASSQVRCGHAQAVGTRAAIARRLHGHYDTSSSSVLFFLTVAVSLCSLAALTFSTAATMRLEALSRPFLSRGTGSSSHPLRLYANLQSEARIFLPPRNSTAASTVEEALSANAESDVECAVAPSGTQRSKSGIDLRTSSDAVPVWEQPPNLSGQNEFADLLVCL